MVCVLQDRQCICTIYRMEDRADTRRCARCPHWITVLMLVTNEMNLYAIFADAIRRFISLSPFGDLRVQSVSTLKHSPKLSHGVI